MTHLPEQEAGGARDGAAPHRPRDTPLHARLAEALDAATERGERRRLVATERLPDGRLRRDGRVLLDFSSNDYLGLAGHPALIEGARRWTERFGTGAGASRLVTGTREEMLAVEARLARWKRTEAALLFASGWQANAAVLAAFTAAAPDLLVFTDRLNHASLHAGLAATRQHRFRHNDLDHLDRLLADAPADAPRLVAVESVYSMDGDRADLPRLAAIARARRAFLYVDEAHATGLFGPGGAGLSAALAGGVDLAMGTFSKAMGGFGAYVAASRAVCDFLVNRCGGFIFTTAPPPACWGAIDAALALVPDMEGERAALAATAARVRDELRAMGGDTGASSTQIIPLIVGEPDEALRLSALLEEGGILAAAIRPPTVPRGGSRLRLALRAGHGAAEIDRLLGALRAAGVGR